jgi:hypothetical protein
MNFGVLDEDLDPILLSLEPVLLWYIQPPCDASTLV